MRKKEINTERRMYVVNLRWFKRRKAERKSTINTKIACTCTEYSKITPEDVDMPPFHLPKFPSSLI
jgi:hypothetical protein